MSNINDLSQGAGKNDALKPNGNFERPPHHGDAYFVHIVSDIYRALPNMPKAAKPLAYNLIELLKNDVMSAPVWGDHPLQKPERLIMRQLEPFERAMRRG